MHRHVKIKAWLLLPALLILVLAGGNCSWFSIQGQSPPVVIVALDGLSWQVAGPLVENGEMPVLAGLAAAGAAGLLETARPTWTPVLFTTMATGKLPAEHGINTFVSDEGIPLTSNLRRVPALWNILSDYDLPVLFFGWPVTWPAEEVRGEMISDRWHKTEQQHVYPAGVAESIAPALRAFRDSAMTPPAELEHLGRLAVPERVSPFLHGSFEGAGAAEADSDRPDRLVQLTRKKVKTGFLWNASLDSVVKLPLFLQRMKAVRPRLAAVYFNVTDMSQHFFGGSDRPGDEDLPERNPAGREAIEETYRVYDRMLGRLVDEVRALKGYQDCIFVILSDHGIDLASGPQVRLVPPDDAEAGGGVSLLRRLMAEADEVEPAVVQAPGPDQEWFRLSFAPSTRMAHRSDRLNRLDAAGCRFHPDDVYLYFVHEQAPPGVVVVSGGELKAGQAINGMSVADVAPTVLNLLDLPAGEDMAGRAVRLWLEGNIWQKPQLTRKTTVPSHGSARSWAESDEAIASPEDQDIREDLRALGYIE